MKQNLFRDISAGVMEADLYLSCILDPRHRRASRKKRAQKDVMHIIKQNLPW